MSNVKSPNAPQPIFARGHSISPARTLLSWLNAHVDAQLRLPLDVALRDNGGVVLHGARLGFARDALVVTGADSAMGVPLTERVAQARGTRTSGRAALLVRARWRGKQRDGLWLLDVVGFEQLLQRSDAGSSSRVDIEAD